jgi:hypothetical protein
MARVALVTGGHARHRRGDLKALKDAGYKVAATYAGNDEAAKKFKAETGIPVYKWSTWPTTRPARPASPRSRPISARSRCWSTMPASPATACSTDDAASSGTR